MDFTFTEIDVLIKMGWLEKDKVNTFGISSISKSTNQGFGHTSLRKTESGEIIYNYSTPVNVDPDDGSCDYSDGTKYYKNFDDFINHKPYLET